MTLTDYKCEASCSLRLTSLFGTNLYDQFCPCKAFLYSFHSCKGEREHARVLNLHRDKKAYHANPDTVDRAS